MRNLESLDAWKRGRELAHCGYRLTLEPPLARHFALADQIRRAAISIPANIAEGYALGTTAQFLRCLRISLGSTVELRAHVDLGCALELVDPSAAAEIATLCDRMVGILLGLIRKLGGANVSRLSPPGPRSPRRVH
jgi:four helix bundle protein